MLGKSSTVSLSIYSIKLLILKWERIEIKAKEVSSIVMSRVLLHRPAAFLILEGFLTRLTKVFKTKGHRTK